MAELFESLGIEPGMIAVNMTGFVLLVLLLKKFAFGPIGDVMAEREREIKVNLDEAEREREMALADRRSLDEELEKLERRAEEIIAKARSDADARHREIVAHAREQGRQIIEEGERAVERAARVARGELRRDSAQIAIEISERAIQMALDDERQRVIVDAFIDDIERIAALEGEGETH